MASPTVASVTESATTTAGTTHTVNFAGSAGDMVVILCGSNSTADWTFSESFTEFHPAGGNQTFTYAFKVLDGTEGTSTTVTTSASVKAAFLAYRITGHDSAEPLDATQTSGTSVNPNSGSLTLPSSKDWLFISGFRQAGEEANDDTWVTAVPTNYSSPAAQVTSGTGGAASTNCQVAGSWRQATTAGPEDPSAFTTAQSLAWNAVTLAIAPGIASQGITPGLISQTAATFTPTITPGAVTVTVGLISQLAAVFAPTVAAAGEAQGVTAGLISQVAATFTPTVVPGTVNIQPPLIGTPASVFTTAITQVGGGGGGAALATILRARRRR